MSTKQSEESDDVRRRFGFRLIRLGDALKFLTNIFKIPPCSECEKRAARLNAIALPILRRMPVPLSSDEKYDKHRETPVSA